MHSGESKGDRGLAGLDALILFIALILVAAVVGMALISTSGVLINRDKALETQKSKDIQRPIIVESLRGFDSNGDQRLDNLIFAVRLRGGDEPVDFNGTVIIVNSKAVNCTSLQYGLATDDNCTYTLAYPKKGKDYDMDRLNSGDFVEVTYSGPNILKGVEDTNSRFTFIPSHGATTEIKAHIPERIYPKNTQIWPLKG
jgi:flagellin-like protein